MDQLDLSVFAQYSKLIALLDKDPKSAKIRKNFKEKCKDLGIPVHQTNRYALENYYPVSILREVFPNQIDNSITEINPKISLQDQIGFSVKKQSRIIAQKMTVESLKRYGFD